MTTLRRLGLALGFVSLALAPDAARATYPGANGKIAWIDVVDRDSPIARYAVFVNGGQFTHPVSAGPQQTDRDSYPAWSADGKLLAFVRYSGLTSSWGVWVIQEDGSNEHQVFEGSQLQASLNPPNLLVGKSIGPLVWLPDNKTIAFVVDYHEYTVQGTPGGDGSASATAQTFTDYFERPAAFDVGEYGTLSWCSFTDIFCIQPGSSFTRIDALADGTPLTFLAPGLQWWPKTNVRRFAVAGTTIRDGITFPEILGVELDTTTNPPRKVEELSSSSTVTCTNTAPNGTTSTSRTAQFGYADPVPSPDGKYFLATRTETIPTNDPNGNCYFAQRKALYRFRSSGQPESSLAEGETATQAAWQAVPGALAVTVDDGHGDLLDGLSVELRRADNPDIVVAGLEARGSGSYALDTVAPGDYLVRVTLHDSEFGAFDIRHGYPAAAPAWVDRGVTVGLGDHQVRLSFQFASDDVVNSSLEGSGHEDRLDDMAVIYVNCRRFVMWVRDHLGQGTGSELPFYTFAETGPAPVPGSLSYYEHDAAGAWGVWMGTDDSDYRNRTSPGDQAPVNGEWHEFAHHLGRQFVHPDWTCGGEQDHGGWANPSSCQALIEGFAIFLASQVQADPDYAGLAYLEAHNKPWDFHLGGTGNDDGEDFAVASLLWDLVDLNADSEATLDINASHTHVPISYVDGVSLSLGDLWAILGISRPRTVFDLHGALSGLPQYFALSKDLDYDGNLDVNPVDDLFLMHGFFPTLLDNFHDGYHYAVNSARVFGLAPNAYVGMSSHNSFVYSNGGTGPQRNPREKEEPNPAANLAIQMVDASGTPLHGGQVDLDVQYPGVPLQTLARTRRDDGRIHLELPAYFSDLLADGQPLPPCGTAGGETVNVTARGALNGFPSLDSTSFDNCFYTQAVLGATGDTALGLTLHFPEDSTPPVTAIDHRTLGVITHGSVQSNSTVLWASGGTWTIALACSDPPQNGFASGCWRTEYSVDGAPFARYIGEFQLTELGPHTVQYRSLDAAENVEAASSIELGVIGAQNVIPPVTTATAVPSVPLDEQGQNSGTWTVTLTCRSDKAGNLPNVACRTQYLLDNGGAVLPYTGPIAVSGIGLHTLLYYSIDLYENTERPVKTLQLRIVGPDLTAPFTIISSDTPARSIVNGSVGMGSWTVHASCADYFGPADQSESGCAFTECSLDGAAYATVAGDISITTPGEHEIVCRSTDLAGNASPPRSDSFELVPESDADGDGLVDFLDNCSAVYNPDQRDTDGDLAGNACDPDFNQNGTVDSNDASLLKSRLGHYSATFDLDGNGAVDAGDMNILKAMFRKPPGPAYGYDYSLLPHGGDDE